MYEASSVFGLLNVAQICAFKWRDWSCGYVLSGLGGGKEARLFQALAGCLDKAEPSNF